MSKVSKWDKHNLEAFSNNHIVLSWGLLDNDNYKMICDICNNSDYNRTIGEHYEEYVISPDKHMKNGFKPP